MRRLAVLSLHTSPLAQPGTGDGGGMNVYVRELASALARTGAACDVFTRAWSPSLPPTVEVEPGLRVHHVPAGPAAPLPKEALPQVVDEFTEGVLDRMTGPSRLPLGDDEGGPFEAIHANYWLSGLAGHAIKHELDLPLVSTFHTLDRVKAEAGPEEVEADTAHRRAEAEAAIIALFRRRAGLLHGGGRADRRALRGRSGPHRRGGARRRPRLLRPGPPPAGPPGPRAAARRHAPALRGAHPAAEGGRHGRPGAGRAVGPPATARLTGWWWWAGPAGRTGTRPTRGWWSWPQSWAWPTGWTMVAPQPHELLSTYYRAADVCLVPSRSESFGLVALEAAACGTPVVASAVGGLTTLVDHGRTGFLVDEPSPTAYADYVRRIVEEPLLAERFSTAAVLRARGLHLAGRRRPSSGRCTTSWWPAGSSSAPEATADSVAPLVDLPGEGAMAQVAGPHRRLGRAGELSPDGTFGLVAAERQDVTDRTASHRWYLRFKGDEKDFITVWLTLRQRTLHHEAQFMPAPEEQRGRGVCST